MKETTTLFSHIILWQETVRETEKRLPDWYVVLPEPFMQLPEWFMGMLFLLWVVNWKDVVENYNRRAA